MTEAFLTKYASRQDAKKNNHHLLSVRTRQEDSLKSYLNFFQNQLTKVSNCGEEVAALAFISGLQLAHPLYKYVCEAQYRQDERDSYQCSVLHPTQRDDEGFL